ncbi:MAG: excinuclease ABC subunit UvrC [Puniceicoccales bacterium]|nr:excinuclease ABC subunit UvrC [Puniceicoccales bacterium]
MAKARGVKAGEFFATEPPLLPAADEAGRRISLLSGGGGFCSFLRMESRSDDNANALTLKEKVRRLPRSPGVYLMKDRGGQVIYIGKAKELKSRVSSYFRHSRSLTPKIAAMVNCVVDFDFFIVRNETEALLLEGRLIKEWRPKFNTLFTDDKQFIQVRVDMLADLPVFRLVRARTTDTARYFGPYPHPFEVKRTLNEMRRRFGILLGDSCPVSLGNGRWKLYDDARADISTHANEVSSDEYRTRVDAACAFLEGRAREWLAALREKMGTAAAAHDYERAAQLRDMADAIARTTANARRFGRISPVLSGGQKEAVRELQDALGLDEPPRTMECFDISHISGTFVVASLVRFADGYPDKANYRRFRIQGFLGNDDFRSMKEVVSRRYRRLVDEGREMPRLVVIDGGAGQVSAALKAFESIGVTPPPLVGLAKREEQIIFHDGRAPLTLSRHSLALRLVQRLRDEAHRFANTYNAELRSKRLRESVLDECPGLGSKRRLALLAQFGSLARLKKASTEELTEVPGIGTHLAQTLVTFLKTI